MKFRRSPIAIICYVIAAVFAAYFIAIAAATLSDINMYYGSEMGFFIKLVYVMQSGTDAIVPAIMTFMAGSILEAIRRLDHRNYYEVPAEEDADLFEEAAAAAGAGGFAEAVERGEVSEAAMDVVREGADEVAGIAEEVAAAPAEVAAEQAEAAAAPAEAVAAPAEAAESVETAEEALKSAEAAADAETM